jgi:peroxiredoxin
MSAVSAAAGAYTSVCSSKHVPNYLERYEELHSNGVDVIACLSVNGGHQ